MKLLFLCLVIISLMMGNGVCDELTLRMVDVGMAESIIVDVDGEVMVVDTAYAKNEDAIRNALNDMAIESIRYLVLTHPHADHIGGARWIIESYPVESAILPPIEHSTATFNNVMDALEENGTELIYPYVGDSFELGDALITVYGPHPVAYESLNNWSIVLMLEFADRRILLTGDIEAEAEWDMLMYSDLFPLSADILKVAHHGSNTSSTYPFVDAVSPDYAIMSCGEDSKVYPDVGVAMNLFDCGVSEIWLTKQQGDIIVCIDEQGNIKTQ